MASAPKRLEEHPPRVHTILHGPDGAGKAHATHELLRAWFDHDLTFGHTMMDDVIVERSARHFGFTSSTCTRNIIEWLNKGNPRETRAAVFYDAHELKHDVQCALRPVTDSLRNYTFIFVTNDPNKLIPPLQSRCVPRAIPLMTWAQVHTILKGMDLDPELAQGERRIHLAITLCHKPKQTVQGLLREMGQFLVDNRGKMDCAREVATRCAVKLVRGFGLNDLEVVRGIALEVARLQPKQLQLCHQTIARFALMDRKCECKWFTVYATILEFASKL